MEETNLHSEEYKRGQYVQVLLPLPLAPEYTYAVPEALVGLVSVGARVLVPFGKNKRHTGVVVGIIEQLPVGLTHEMVKEVVRVSDALPIIVPAQLELWRWIASYYMSPLGDVLRAALPNALRDEDAEVKYSAKTEAYLEAAFDVADVELLQQLEQQLRRSPKQMELWSKFLAQAVADDGALHAVARTQLAADDGASSLINALIKKGLLRIYNKVVSRIPLPDSGYDTASRLKQLSQPQTDALASIRQSFNTLSSTLLWGVTGSGKTEIYIHLAHDVIRQGKQVLYLVPEIALTTQLTERLREPFGSNLAVYHSKLTDAERVEIWQQQLSECPFPIVLGVRSSVFLPFKNLGLIIIDEEHESTYKQQDPAPRYHARSVALYLAQLSGAKTLLGSATPSLESYYNGLAGKYGLVKLNNRHFDSEDVEALPIRKTVIDSRTPFDVMNEELTGSHLLLIHTSELRRKRVMKSLFAPQLIDVMRHTLEEGRQAVVFQNRRGYAQYMECGNCGYIPRCPHCAVSLTYHRSGSRTVKGEHLSCHYCGTSFACPTVCPSCKGHRFTYAGVGTQQVQEYLREVFPDFTIERMDLDTTQRKNAVKEMVERIQTGKSHILVGTQIVTKGFDFDGVTLVAILNADYLMNLPDFRSHERAFQLMKQVAGRAGRRGSAATVAIQTSDPSHPIFQYITGDDDDDFFQMQLHERNRFSYPPYTRLIVVHLSSSDEELVQNKAVELAERLRTVFAERVLGPDSPPVNMVAKLHMRRLLIKLELSTSAVNAKKHLAHIVAAFQKEDKDFRKIILYYDVDPA